MEHRPFRKKIGRLFNDDLLHDTQRNPGNRKSVSTTIIKSATSALLVVTIIAALGALFDRGGICLSKYGACI